MSKIEGYILRLSTERWEILESCWRNADFAEPVREFQHSRSVPLICFVITPDDTITHIALGKRGLSAGTDLRRLNLSEIFSLESEISCETASHITLPRFQSKISEKLASGGKVPPKTLIDLIRVISELAPETANTLSMYGEDRHSRISRLSSKSKDALANQKEAVATALAIANIDRDELLGWNIDEDEKPTSFLDGLEQVRLREDPMVINDLMTFPGHDAIKKTPYNSVVFENDKSKLTVVLANRLPLEELTGTDLIYYNETFSCFLMVQYKAMEKEGDSILYRFPNAQLTKEVDRMNEILKELNKCVPNDEADGYRLTENPFFLKICPRIVFEPDNVALVKGMYLPLDYWKHFSKHSSTLGKKGGQSVSYKNVRRYFDNSTFVTLASGAWVGTNIKQSKVLEKAIRSTLESGRAVVLAVNSDKNERNRKPVENN